MCACCRCCRAHATAAKRHSLLAECDCRACATAGYLLWPSGQDQPFVSTLNALDGSITANAAIVPAGNGGGSVSAMVTNQVDLVLDVNGYFGP